MTDYVCPGCEAHDIADECWHEEDTWALAQAIAVGLPGGAATWGTGVERAWAFIDDADALNGRVGDPPYAVEMFHPDKMEPYTTIGLINGRYLFAMPNVEGEALAEFIGDCGDRLTIVASQPTDPCPVCSGVLVHMLDCPNRMPDHEPKDLAQ